MTRNPRTRCRRGIDRDLRHVRGGMDSGGGASGGRRTRVVVLGLLLVVVVLLAGAGGGTWWVLRSEDQDLAAQLAVAQGALDDSEGRVADPAVRAALDATIDDARAVLDARPVLDRLPGDAPAVGTRLAHDVDEVLTSRLAFARAQVAASRDALAPVTRRAEQVVAATDELAADGHGADETARTAAHDALATTDDLLAETGDDALAAAPLADIEDAATRLAAQDDTLDGVTADLMTAQDAVVCPFPDQVWFPQAGRLATSTLAPIPWAPQYSVRADVLDGLVALDDAYRAQFGQHLVVNSAYRSYAQQVDVYDPQDPNPLAAPPGCSNHGLGTAVDISMGPEGFDSARYAWLKEHAPEHGWTHPGWAEPDGRLPEPWHWQSVETPTSY